VETDQTWMIAAQAYHQKVLRLIQGAGEAGLSRNEITRRTQFLGNDLQWKRREQGLHLALGHRVVARIAAAAHRADQGTRSPHGGRPRP
jgi:hypothetical protein